MATSTHGIYSRIIDVTPELAEQWLALSAYNRLLSHHEIVQLSAAMKRGEWTFSSDLIGFNIRGELMNGHHRLHAVKLSGMTVPMQVNFGLPVQTYEITDTGRKRSYSDRMRLPRGVTDVLRLGCAIVFNVSTPTLAQMKPILDAGFQRMVEQLVDYCPRRVRVFSSAAVKLSAVVTIMQNPVEQAYVFAQYRALCEHEYDAMTTIVQTFARQVAMSQGLRTDTWNNRDLLVRGCKVFDRLRQDHTRLQVKDGEWDVYRRVVRDVLMRSAEMPRKDARA